MHRGIRVLALLAGYTTLGFSGDYVAGLVAHDPPSVRLPAAEHAVGVALAAASSSDRCAFEVERKASLDAPLADMLHVDVGAGELRVEGRDGLSGIQVVGRACASARDNLDALQVALGSEGGDIELRAHYPEHSGRHRWGGEDYARIDLVVLVPRGMAIDLKDSSGGMELSGTGALHIEDSSGEIVVRDANGAVTIDDSSGGIDVSGVVGDVSIQDGSGGIEVSNVKGRLELRDGSGSIHAEHVEGDVVVAGDGSGSIDVRDVRGDFQVRSDGSGGIRYSTVGGKVDIPRDKHASHRGS